MKTPRDFETQLVPKRSAADATYLSLTLIYKDLYILYEISPQESHQDGRNGKLWKTAD